MLTKENQPIKIYFEVTNYCNFACDFCPILESVRKRQHMEFDLFKKGIDEIAANRITDTVGFHILGEPLMYPHLFEAVEYARKNGLRTEINTNGSLLTPLRAKKLVDSGLDQLAISVQILSEEEHKCRGSHLGFHRYYTRVMDAIRTIREQNSRMELVLCFMNKNSKKYFDIDKNIRMDWNGNGHPSELPPYIHDICIAMNKEVPEDNIKKALNRLNLNLPQTLHIDEYTRVYVHPFADWGNAFTKRKVIPAKLGFCGYALSNVGVLNNGEVTICCADFDGKTSLGNLQHKTFLEMLTSCEAQKIRDGFKKMRVVHPYCQRCIGSTNPIKSLFKGVISIYLFKIKKFQPAKVKEVPLV